MSTTPIAQPLGAPQLPQNQFAAGDRQQLLHQQLSSLQQDLRAPRRGSGYLWSSICAVATGVFLGAVGTGFVALGWEGLRSRIGGGLKATASGTAELEGNATASGDFDAQGETTLENPAVDSFGYRISSASETTADVDMNGQVDFDGQIAADQVDLDLADGEVAADIGPIPLRFAAAAFALLFAVCSFAGYVGHRLYHMNKRQTENDMRHNNIAMQNNIQLQLIQSQLSSAV